MVLSARKAGLGSPASGAVRAELCDRYVVMPGWWSADVNDSAAKPAKSLSPRIKTPRNGVIFMSKPQLGAEEYRSAAFTFLICVIALLAVTLSSGMSISELVAPNTLLIVGAISLAAAIADLVIKYRRLQKGITTADLMRQFERDYASGQHFVHKPLFRWSMVIVGVVSAGVAFVASQFIG